MRMRESKGTRRLALSRTLLILFAVVACWARSINTQWFMQACVFVMGPWTVFTVIGELFHRQIEKTPYNALLFAMSGIFMLTTLYNRGQLLTGLTIFAVACALAALTHWLWRDTGDKARDRRRRVICLTVGLLCIAVFIPFFVSCYNGNGWKLPWSVEQAAQAPRRGGANARAQRAMQAFAYSRDWLLSDLSILIFVCFALLVAGIRPKDISGEYTRRESLAVCGLIAALCLMLMTPAVYSVFIGKPVVISCLGKSFGVTSPGFLNDRIRAADLHPNLTSQYALVGLLSTLYCLLRARRWWTKAVLAVVSPVFLIAIVHTQSRTTNIALGVGVAAIVFRLLYLRLQARRWRVPISLLAGALTVILTVLSINALFSVDMYISLQRNATIQPNSTPAADTAPTDSSDAENTTPPDDKLVLSESASKWVMTSRASSEGSLNVTGNGRGLVWKEGVDYLLHNPLDLLFGMGAGDIVERMRAYNPDRFDAYHLHNGFLETLARGGAFMLLCLIAALLLLVRPTARLLTQRDASDPGSFMFALFIGVPLTISLSEALLFIDVSLFNLMFFYAASRAMQCGPDA